MVNVIWSTKVIWSTLIMISTDICNLVLLVQDFSTLQLDTQYNMMQISYWFLI